MRHDQRWAYEIKNARPIEDLLPEGTDPANRANEIDRQLRRLIPLVAADINRAGLPVQTIWDIPEGRHYDKEKDRIVDDVSQRTYHLIGNYFELPHDPAATAFGLVIGKLDEGIGVYEDLKRRAAWEFVNPLAWVAHLLHVPVWVMERAGLIDPDESPSAIIRAYGWILRALWLIAVALVLKKLGLVDLVKEIIAKL